MSDTATTVTSLLAAAGISPDADEVDALIESYPAQRASADLLHTVDGMADVAPVLAFSLVPFAG
jgi:hypothetical protein